MIVYRIVNMLSTLWFAWSFFFFFFQAEDGIRDLTVIGVQTCALPISLLKAYERMRLRERAAVVFMGDGVLREPLERYAREHGLGGAHFTGFVNQAAIPKHYRSEERRVGKECRSRWSPYH